MISVSSLLCAYFNRMPSRLSDFYPEAFSSDTLNADGICSSVIQSASASRLKSYVNGTTVKELMYEIGIRVRRPDYRKRAEMLSYLANIERYIRDSAHIGETDENGVELMSVKTTGGGSRHLVFENGDEEYILPISASCRYSLT